MCTLNEWCITVARAMRMDCCSCRSIERSLPSDATHWCSPARLLHIWSLNKRRRKTCLSLVVVVVVVVQTLLFDMNVSPLHANAHAPNSGGRTAGSQDSRRPRHPFPALMAGVNPGPVPVHRALPRTMSTQHLLLHTNGHVNNGVQATTSSN